MKQNAPTLSTQQVRSFTEAPPGFEVPQSFRQRPVLGYFEKLLSRKVGSKKLDL